MRTIYVQYKGYLDVLGCIWGYMELLEIFGIEPNY